MAEFAVIAQNDESKWDDIKGDLYHFPNMQSSRALKPSWSSRGSHPDTASS